MTVQTSSGPIVVGPGDFQRTDRGITWAIKCRDIEGTQFATILVKQDNGSWAVGGMVDDGFDLTAKNYPTMIDWFKNVLLPRLNAWLAATFPAPTEGPTPEPVGATLLEQADHLINNRLLIRVNADGTLVAELK